MQNVIVFKNYWEEIRIIAVTMVVDNHHKLFKQLSPIQFNESQFFQQTLINRTKQKDLNNENEVFEPVSDTLVHVLL